MDKKQRLIGVDLFRAIAAYAVVVIHAEHQASIPASWAAKFVQFSTFAVPFFLATSFYLTMNSLYVKKSQFSLKSRLPRLLIPYGIWSTIYIFKSGFEYFLKHGEVTSIFQDPLKIICFGGAAYHLYFIPLLMAGIITVKFVKVLINKQIELQPIIFMFIFSIIIYHLLLVSGNSFQLSSGVAFQNLLKTTDGNTNLLLRLALVELSWIIRCLPYILMAMILNHPNIRKNLTLDSSYTIIFFFMFVGINAFGSSFITEGVYEIARGYLALLFAISLSSDLKENSIIKNLGLCSFGIYLVHLLVVHTFQSIAKRLYPGSETMPVSLMYLVILSIISFLVSWIITFFLTKNKSVSKLMFGA